MLRHLALSLLIFAAAFAILLASVTSSSSLKYSFNYDVSAEEVDSSDSEEKVEIDYSLPYPGRVLPDNFLWSVKVVRDKFWLLITRNPVKKSETLLLLADKRLVSAQILITKKNKHELGVSVLTKSSKYLEKAAEQEKKARSQGEDTGQFLEKLAQASLKHRQVMEELVVKCPEDAKPRVMEVVDYPKRIFTETQVALLEVGRPSPENPFD